MRSFRLIAWAALVTACTVAPPPGDGPAGRSLAPAAAPTTRLVLPGARDRDCADFARRADAQRALRPGDPDHLDADRDGRACEKLR